MLALRVAFEGDDNLSTTGDGSFLMSLDSLSVPAVACDGFLVDPPPHNGSYFQAQLQAVANYFNQTTGGQVTIDLAASPILPATGDPILVGPMASYRPEDDDPIKSDSLIVELLAEVLGKAEEAGFPLTDFDIDIVVIFHAGLGQDFNYPILDPTPLDIPSTFIDRAMIAAATGSPVLQLPLGTAFNLPAILVPESQNHIYYDIADDIFFGQTDLCDVQIGLTGTLTLLMGYALGFPPLFDTSTGTTGVGVFGLMDLGSGNGQGVIPAPPSAWLRSTMFQEPALELEGPVNLVARHLPAGLIGRVTLSTREYLLIENRLNWIYPDTDIDSLRFRNLITNADNTLSLPHYFDFMTDSAGLTVDTLTGVITGVPNYDLGLPGSGLLIWHIDESRYTAGLAGLNNDPERRAVRILEADGAIDIGFPTTAIFGDPTIGYRWDLWYAGNPDWLDANPSIETGPEKWLRIDAETHPPLRLNSRAEVGVRVIDIGPAGSALPFTVENEATVPRLPDGSLLLGFTGTDWIVRRNDSLLLGNNYFADAQSQTTVVVSEHDAVLQPGDGFWTVDAGFTTYTVRRYDSGAALDFAAEDSLRLYVDQMGPYHPFYEDGLLHVWSFDGGTSPNPDRFTILPAIDTSLIDGISYGDIDGDGSADSLGVLLMHAAFVGLTVNPLTGNSANGVALDGFPIDGYFESPALIANLVGDKRPEIIAVESGDIAIYGPEGDLWQRVALRTAPENLFLIPATGGKVGIANGDRIHWFTPESQNLQWVTYQGRHSRNHQSLNDGILRAAQPAILDRSRVYNYPNPVTDGKTTIRFYTGQASRGTIRIYTVDGLTVEQVELADLVTNGYNEWVWNVGDNPGGLYYGVVEVQGSARVSALIKIAVVK